MRTRIYIDGYNLFYGCLKHSEDKWLDLYELFANKIVRQQTPRAQVEKINFFTANIKAKIATNGQLAQQAQQTYHNALMQCYPEHISIIKGYYSLEKARLLAYKKPPDKAKRVDVWRLEEKQTDVSLALAAYRDTVREHLEQVVFVSNDTDLEPVLRALREDFRDKLQIGIVIPIRFQSRRPANQRLSQYADWTRSYISDDELKMSQLADKIATNKKPIRKPHYW